MKSFYLTFGSQYPREPHPRWQYAHNAGYVRIEAPDDAAARDAATRWLGDRWSFLYDSTEWEPGDWYPRGELAVVSVRRDGIIIDESRAARIAAEEQDLLAASDENRTW